VLHSRPQRPHRRGAGRDFGRSPVVLHMGQLRRFITMYSDPVLDFERAPSLRGISRYSRPAGLPARHRLDRPEDWVSMGFRPLQRMGWAAKNGNKGFPAGSARQLWGARIGAVFSVVDDPRARLNYRRGLPDIPEYWGHRGQTCQAMVFGNYGADTSADGGRVHAHIPRNRRRSRLYGGAEFF